MASINNKNPHIKLIHSSDVVRGAQECFSTCTLPLEKTNSRVALCSKEGLNRNEPSSRYDVKEEAAWLKKLKLSTPPFFLRKFLKNDEQQIFICQHGMSNEWEMKPNHEHLQEVLLLKFWLRRFEKIFHYASSQCVQGVLFMVPDDQNDFFVAFEELFAYGAPHLDMYGERSYWYLPTDQEAYDDFVDLSEDMNMELDRYLWREQKSVPWLRQYLQSMDF